jgi:anti-anti-sigma factor
MTDVQAQSWKGSTFHIERVPGNIAGSVIFRMSGPFTARDRFGSLTPEALRALFDTETDEPESLRIFDLTNVPYMDSIGVGMLITEQVRCQAKGLRMVAVGVSQRVLELLKITRLDTLIPMAATVAEAEGR